MNVMTDLSRTFPAHPQAQCHVNDIPAFAESVLARLYGHVHSSLPYLQAFRSLDHVSTYVERCGDRITELILFDCTNRRATVLNEGVRFEQASIARFCRHVFSQFPTIAVIGFHQVEARLDRLVYPFQRYDQSENYVLPLPPTVDDYTAALGKSTRRNIKRYLGKLLADHPSFDCRFQAGAQIERRHFERLLAMSKAKIGARGARFGIDPDYAEGLWKLATRTGFMSLATAGGQVCAGLICFRIGTYYFALVVAHDPDFDAYWLGTLCYYLTICEAIRRGGTVFNMGPLHYDYKERLLGTRHDLQRIDVYRSRLHCLLQARCVARMAAGRGLRACSLWLRRNPHRLLTRSLKAMVYRLHCLRGR